MSIKKRIWFSFVIGWTIKIIPLWIFILFENAVTARIAGIANVDAVIALMLISNASQATLAHIIVVVVGFLSGLIIYPIIIFMILTIWQKLKGVKAII